MAFFYKVLNKLIRRTQRLLGAATVGVRAIVINENRQILLVRHTYTPGWYLPGGGVNNGETASAAIIRELKEETGITVMGAPMLFSIYFHVLDGVNDYPVLYIVNQFNQTKVSSPEIAEVKWFDFETLPQETTACTKKRLNEFFQQNALIEHW